MTPTAAAARRVVKLETAIDSAVYRSAVVIPAARIRSSSSGVSAADGPKPASTKASSMKSSGPSVIRSMTAKTPAPFAAR